METKVETTTQVYFVEAYLGQMKDAIISQMQDERDENHFHKNKFDVAEMGLNSFIIDELIDGETMAWNHFSNLAKETSTLEAPIFAGTLATIKEFVTKALQDKKPDITRVSTYINNVLDDLKVENTEVLKNVYENIESLEVENKFFWDDDNKRKGNKQINEYTNDMIKGGLMFGMLQGASGNVAGVQGGLAIAGLGATAGNFNDFMGEVAHGYHVAPAQAHLREQQAAANEAKRRAAAARKQAAANRRR